MSMNLKRSVALSWRRDLQSRPKHERRIIDTAAYHMKINGDHQSKTKSIAHYRRGRAYTSAISRKKLLRRSIYFPISDEEMTFWLD